MTHSDDRGLVLPPRLASLHAVIVPILSNASKKTEVLAAAHELAQAIRAAGAGSKLPYEIGVQVDQDETKQPGWKFHEYELIGIPLRIEVGPRDLEKGQVVMTRRDLGQKEMVPLAEVAQKVVQELDSMQKDLLNKARVFRDQNFFEIEDYAEFKKRIEQPGGFFAAPWCQSKECEAKVKEETKATIRCLPMGPDFRPISLKCHCMACGGSGSVVRAVFAKSY